MFIYSLYVIVTFIIIFYSKKGGIRVCAVFRFFMMNDEMMILLMQQTPANIISQFLSYHNASACISVINFHTFCFEYVVVVVIKTSYIIFIFLVFIYETNKYFEIKRRNK